MAFGRELLKPLQQPLSHPRMNDGVQRRSSLVVAKHDGREGRTVQTAAGRHHPVPETGTNLGERRLAGFDHFPRQDVGIDDGNRLAEARGNRALARRNASGQSEHAHEVDSAAIPAGCKQGKGSRASTSLPRDPRA